MTELLKLKKFKCETTYTSRILEIKKEDENKSIIKFLNWKKKVILETDLLNLGIGAVLYQEEGVLGYFSKKLTDTERNYSIVEKNLYAILKALIFF